MLRSLALPLTLLLATAALAQTDCSTACPKVEYAAISGQILNATNNSPIAGATIDYRGTGGSSDGNNHVLNPPTIHGELTTGPDGTYTLPKLPPGDYQVRVSAPGFFGARRSLHEHIIGNNLPPGFPVQNSGFRLQPNNSLTSMSMKDFPAGLGQGYGTYGIELARFSRDADSLLFSLRSNPRPQLWLYQLSTQKLEQIILPPEVDGISQIAWDGTTALFAAQKNGDPFAAGLLGSVTLPNLEAKVIPTPAGIDAQITIARLRPDPIRFRPEQIAVDCNPTGDVHSSACHSLLLTDLVVHDNLKHRTINVTRGTGQYVLYDATSTLIYDATDAAEYGYDSDHLIELNLDTGEKTVAVIPGPISSGVINLLDATPVRNSAHYITGFLVAYQREGDCDPGALSQAPSFVTESDEHFWDEPAPWSVCFVTLPYTPPPPHPSTTAHHPAPKH